MKSQANQKKIKDFGINQNLLDVSLDRTSSAKIRRHASVSRHTLQQILFSQVPPPLYSNKLKCENFGETICYLHSPMLVFDLEIKTLTSLATVFFSSSRSIRISKGLTFSKSRILKSSPFFLLFFYFHWCIIHILCYYSLF